MPLDDVIDWTVSYRQDSTIFRPYCYALKRETSIQDFMNNYTARFLPHSYEKNYESSYVEARDQYHKTLLAVYWVWWKLWQDFYACFHAFHKQCDQIWWIFATFKSIWQYLEGLLSIWLNVKSTFANFICHWGILRYWLRNYLDLMSKQFLE